MISRAIACAFAVLSTASLSGCIALDGVSAPPIAHPAEHSVDVFGDDVVHLDRGTVLAFDCVDSFTGDPCALSTMVLADKKVVEVLPAHLERKPNPYGYGRDQVGPRSGFVLVAKQAGETTLTIDSSIGQKTVRILVD